MTAYSDRICDPQETWNRIGDLLPRFGITRLSRLTGLDRLGIPVWNAVTPNARSIVIHQGKGVTDLDAKVSAAMEALERAVAADPLAKAHIASQRALRAAGDAYLPLDGYISAGKPPLGDDEPVAWLCGRDLVTGNRVFVPREAACLDRTDPAPRFWQSSDGLASGNDETEATLHGLLERIERDADRLWRLSPPKHRLDGAIDPAAFGDTVIDDLAERMTAAGLLLRLFDISSDIGLPTFAAALGEADIHTKAAPLFHDATIGYGTHPSAVRAVIRALTEVAQSRLTFISGARDDLFPETFTRPLAPQTRALFDAEPRAVSPPPAPQGNAEQLLALCLHRLGKAGIAPLVAVLLTDGSLPFTVVKVVAPGLESPEGARRQTLGPRALAQITFEAV